MRTFIYHTRLDNKSNFDKIMLLFTGVILDSQSWQIFKMSGGLVSTAASSICVEGWDVRRPGTGAGVKCFDNKGYVFTSSSNPSVTVCPNYL